MSVKEHVPKLKEKVEYIKNLYEVIRGCYRVLTPEEEMREEKVNFARRNSVNHSVSRGSVNKLEEAILPPV